MTDWFMEQHFDNRDFERTVRQHADQFRMFPSDRVWKGVENALHRRRRWYGIGLALLLVTTATVTMVMVTPSDRSEFVRLGRNASFTIGLPLKEVTTTAHNLVESPAVIERAKTRSYPSGLAQHYINNPEQTELDQPLASGVETADLVDHYRNETEPATEPADKQIPAISRPAAIVKPANLLSGTDLIKRTSRPLPGAEAVVDLPVANDAPDLFLAAASIGATGEKQELKKQTGLFLPPYTIESVLNSYRHKKGDKKKWNWLLYFTPTISYRTLTENTEFISAARYNSIVNGTGNNTNPVYYSTDVNSVVQHRPDLGMQLGLRGGLPLSQWFSLTAGLQLGISKYDIKASQSNLEVASIALTTRNTLNTVTNLRNDQAGRTNWLRNFYFSASIPLGMELKLSDGSRNYFGIATTLQPTFVLDNRAYLITTDYKNYAEVPSLTRKFNMNTSFELFSAHTTGKLQWRIGPQVHYQLMSSFIKNYPIKEHLFDFGLKLGIQLK